MVEYIIQFLSSYLSLSLVTIVTVNVGRAGAASLDVIQEVEYVKQEAKVVYLLECLQKTPPPVLVFSEKKAEVDDIHEYLLLKGVEAVSIHGGRDQEERQWAIREFREGRKDVLVATDVASKGLDFPNIQHVINYDMPTDIENYGMYCCHSAGMLHCSIIEWVFQRSPKFISTCLPLKQEYPLIRTLFSQCSLFLIPTPVARF